MLDGFRAAGWADGATGVVRCTLNGLLHSNLCTLCGYMVRLLADRADCTSTTGAWSC